MRTSKAGWTPFHSVLCRLPPAGRVKRELPNSLLFRQVQAKGSPKKGCLYLNNRWTSASVALSGMLLGTGRYQDGRDGCPSRRMLLHQVGQHGCCLNRPSCRHEARAPTVFSPSKRRDILPDPHRAGQRLDRCHAPLRVLRAPNNCLQNLSKVALRLRSGRDRTHNSNLLFGAAYWRQKHDHEAPDTAPKRD